MQTRQCGREAGIVDSEMLVTGGGDSPRSRHGCGHVPPPGRPGVLEICEHEGTRKSRKKSPDGRGNQDAVVIPPWGPHPHESHP